MATLKLTVQEDLTIGGVQRGSTKVTDYSTITQADTRLMEVGTAEVSVFKLDTSVGSGQFKTSDLVYARISNNSDTGGPNVTVRVLGTGEEYFFVLEPGDIHIFSNAQMDANATGSQAFSTANIAEVKAVSSSGTATIELLVASS